MSLGSFIDLKTTDRKLSAGRFKGLFGRTRERPAGNQDGGTSGVSMPVFGIDEVPALSTAASRVLRLLSQ
jgi:hypothetical protein